MHVEERGPEPYEIAVCCLVHGDEPAGKYAVDRLCSEDLDLQKGVKFIYVNEQAFEQGQRYIDRDLNRVTGSDQRKTTHEGELAGELVEEVSGFAVLDLHTTKATGTPFALFSETFTHTDPEVIRATGVDEAVDMSEIDGGIDSFFNGVTVECGRNGSDEAVENAVEICRRFLVNMGALPGTKDLSDPHIFRTIDAVPKETSAMFEAENLEKVDRGEVYARSSDGPLQADRSFYPVLMSADGYDDILGFRTEKIGTLSDLSSS